MTLVQRLSGDFAFLRGILRVLRRSTPIAKRPDHTLGDTVDELAARFADRVALVSEAETFTYRQWGARANRYARWTLARGFGKGDTLCLLMRNRAEYLSVWMGVAKAGAATALLNTNLGDAALAHSIRIVGARLVIVEAPLLERLAAALPLVGHAVAVVVHGDAGALPGIDREDLPRIDTGALPRIDLEVEGFADTPLGPGEKPALTIDDKCLYVYTSGTTGLPKAANLNHYRVQLAMAAFAGVAGARPSDRIYDCLPMYHTNGGVLAPGLVLSAGGTCVIRERFSAREFWPDVVRHGCTMVIYIGELCRYLVQAPPGPDDRRHKVRLCIGNGLRPDVWGPFTERFGIRTIREFYASTEGNCSVFNLDSHPGAVGRVPGWIASRFPIEVIRFDVEHEAAVRGPDGLCLLCGPDEVGEVVGEILSDPARPGNRFEGYTDRAATQSKILRDVKRTGDAWFRTGDLMRRDALGYFYFVDRVGDTFRWKGENVATSEVSEAMTDLDGVREANVYGVAVPGTEGRAGMVSLVLDDPARFDPAAFHAHLTARLPPYAVPVFVRLTDHLAVTGTFKQRKVEMVAEGFDPGRIADPLFHAEAGRRGYRRLDADAYARIARGDVRL